MSEVKFLRDQIETTYKGDSWHGPNLVNTLKDIDYKQAMKRPIEHRHTIWELTDHTSFWMEEIWKSIRDHKGLEPDMDENWPEMGATEEEWKQSVARLEASVNMVLDALAMWRDEELYELVPGEKYTFKQMLHGMVHHNLYHAGQINLLRDQV
ncbi:MAG: DinB family protein [Candidatus Bathyarchaeota archaeon]|nr:DinB family protein [Candidatus Bathyarchaeota archaeon]